MRLTPLIRCLGFVDFCEDINLKDNIKLLYKYIDVLSPREKRIIER